MSKAAWVFWLHLVLWLASVQAATGVDAYLKKPQEWYASPEGKQIAATVLTWQAPEGGWPKNVDTSQPHPDGTELHGTFDNGATTGELRFLAKAHRATGDVHCKEAFLKGFDHILKAQYPTGGWPQYYPPSKKYHRHITFNDNAMVRLMEFLREAAGGGADFALLDEERRAAANKAFDKGVECIIKCQVKVGGKLTVWCAQHDELDLSPRPARAFELVSLSGSESAGILLLLMSLKNPSPEVVQAVDAGAAWFESAKLTGIKETKVDGDKRIVKDAAAPSLWARFYEIESGRPFFCGRDGVKKYDIAEIEAERRNGYSWYGNWGERVAASYAKWKAGRGQ